MIIVQLDSEQLSSVIQNAVRKVISETTLTEPATEKDQWFDLDGLEAYLPEKLARATLYGKLASGEIPGHKRGKKWYFLKSEIDFYLKQGRRKTLAETEAEADKYLLNKKGLTNGK